jgi:uncharacterized protein (DUF1697 family)
MATYISLLRGINVSGKNMIKMPELVEALEKEGFLNITTYIQSGNIIFTRTDLSCEEAAIRIEATILRNFGLAVPAVVLTADEFSAINDSNPLMKRPGIDQEKLHVTFLSRVPSGAAVEKLLSCSFPPDTIIISQKVVYLYLPNGYGRTKFNNTFIENKLGVTATTRNWRTCLTVREMMEKEQKL